jgi:hypothetical protein
MKNPSTLHSYQTFRPSVCRQKYTSISVSPAGTQNGCCAYISSASVIGNLEGEICWKPRKHLGTFCFYLIRPGADLDVFVQNGFEIPGDTVNFGPGLCGVESCTSPTSVVCVPRCRVRRGMFELPELLNLVIGIDCWDVVIGMKPDDVGCFKCRLIVKLRSFIEFRVQLRGCNWGNMSGI